MVFLFNSFSCENIKAKYAWKRTLDINCFYENTYSLINKIKNQN